MCESSKNNEINNAKGRAEADKDTDVAVLHASSAQSCVEMHFSAGCVSSSMHRFPLYGSLIEVYSNFQITSNLHALATVNECKTRQQGEKY